ncbi:MAG TPA: hypothetical protein VE958_05195 [Bryobacteraceae bacterium]|nr:hypothetical protein [Bryobacteraceae bacterium]
MKTRMIAVALVFCSTMTAQISSYLGPGILSRGAGDIGTRAGQDVDLRFYVNATGIYDNGLQPYSLDSTGHLLTVNGLWGTEVALGAYGVHNFRHARLGLDYTGTYRHYSEKSFYDGSDQQLSLGYTFQKSRRLIFDMRHLAGTVSQGTSFASGLPNVPDALVTPSSLLFDNRANYLQSTLDVNYLKSERTVFTFGGQGFGIWRKATGLIGAEGYQLHGKIQHRLSQRTTVGVEYQHIHYDFPKAFGESDINSLSGIWATQLGRFWTVSLMGGAFQAEVQGLQRVSVDPQIAALLGVTSTVETFYRKSTFPMWDAAISRRFQRASLSFHYNRGISPGNGVYLTSRQENAAVSLSYTATRKWSFYANAGYSRLDGIGQNLQAYIQFNGGGGVTYAITSPIHFIANYEARHQEIMDLAYRRSSYRATIGISFSPGDIPLAFH